MSAHNDIITIIVVVAVIVVISSRVIGNCWENYIQTFICIMKTKWLQE